MEIAGNMGDNGQCIWKLDWNSLFISKSYKTKLKVVTLNV
jgi:hypothetical protein